MKRVIRRATIVACAAVLTASGGSAFARPHHHHHHRSAHLSHFKSHRVHHVSSVRAVTGNPYYSGPGAARAYPMEEQASVTSARRRMAVRYHRRARTPVAAPTAGEYGGNALVAEARRYIGTNPTGRRSLWCGTFMDMVLRETGHKGGGNLATGYLHYGPRVPGPRVGAIAVMYRKGGGHVGIVSGIDPNGNPIIVSGNHNHRVAESVYPRRRIAAYVMPGR